MIPFLIFVDFFSFRAKNSITTTVIISFSWPFKSAMSHANLNLRLEILSCFSYKKVFAAKSSRRTNFCFGYAENVIPNSGHAKCKALNFQVSGVLLTYGLLIYQTRDSKMDMIELLEVNGYSAVN